MPSANDPPRGESGCGLRGRASGCPASTGAGVLLVLMAAYVQPRTGAHSLTLRHNP